MAGLGQSLEAVVTNREPMLRALVQGPLTKPELTEAVDSSRSTIDRAVRELVDAGLVRRADGRYEATLAGRSALDAVEAFHDRMRGVESAAGVLSHLGPDAPIDSDFLTGADVHVATPEMPDSVVQRLFDSVESATHLRGIAPVALSGHLRGFYEAARANDARVEMVINADVLDSLVATTSTRETLLAQLRDERVTILRGEVPFSFGLWLTETEAGVVVYSDTGVRGIIVNDTADACAWAETWFETLSTDARRLTPSGIEADN
ncbi:hypothetical protein C474_05995 [Halogeometricum pallidum JCM 14848]|uniref:HTH marR-type domain-containing protein n=1 Tax=Halogeometricum pallidum JCM 14848 TaxID=1227487 RepID=M0DBG2_HALPD|nr:winged helix-turn-helix domain-containing protein [Halogeometricum pallidum]ELZ32801.1 hypothetical protein C474_05995 [Halogeometricum pallidum JCM 14848]